MAFRDDLEAARARSEALERRVAELEAENRRLRVSDTPPEVVAAPRIQRGLRGAGLPFLGATAILGTIAVGAVWLDRPVVAGIVALLALALCVQIIALSRMLYVAPPHVALVISGHRRRVVIGGRAMRIPLLERVDALDLRAHPVDVSLAAAYCRGGTPIAIELSARVHIARSRPRIDSAIDRFLGLEITEVTRVAGETLEAEARAVIARLSLAEMQLDRDKLACEIIAEAEPLMEKLGLEIESLSVVEIR